MIDLSQYLNVVTVAYTVIIGFMTFFFTNRLNQKKAGIEGDASTVNNAKEFQEMYEKAFETFETRWNKRLAEQEKDCEKQINGARRALEDQAREKQGEMLVMIDELTKRNQDLKVQIAELGGIVQGATGVKIHQWVKKEE